MVAKSTQTPPEMYSKRKKEKKKEKEKEKEKDEPAPTNADQADSDTAETTAASNSRTDPAATPTITNPRLPQSRDQAIPLELWSLVSEFLTLTDLRSFRFACPQFYHAAHLGYARTLDRRAFPLTCQDLEWLVEILKKTKAGPHIKTLRIDAQVACKCQEEAYRTWVERNNHYSLNGGRNKVFLGFSRRGPDESTCAGLVKELVELVPNLTSIELRTTKRSEAAQVQSAGGFLPQPPVREKWLSVQRWATWRAMELLIPAFVETWNFNSRRYFAPAPRTMLIRAPVPLEALPGHLVPVGRSRLFANLTKLSLSLARMEREWYVGYGRVDVFLPQFLELLPRTLEDLALEFPKDRTLRTQSVHTPAAFDAPLFGDHGWGAVVDDNRISFPVLRVLHLTHLSLSDVSSLQTFLRKHTTTLRSLRLTSLALVGHGWKPFVQFLGGRMTLDTLVMDSDMSAQEREVERRIWQMTPPQQHPSAEEWLMAATEIRMNGKRWGKGKRGVEVEEGEAVAAHGQGGNEEEQVDAEESGYEGDADGEGLAAT